MTARGYPDCDATSPNGRYRLEARSPHNGTIPHRNGQFATDAEYGFAYRDHQSHFRYQLLDTATGNEVVWERWQAHTENSPDEVVVNDDGWSILRVCGDRPEVIAVTPSGRDALRVVIADSHRTEQEVLAGVVNRGANARGWCPNTLVLSSAGRFWTRNSWRYFLTALGTRYFVWRSARGARLIIDLDAEELVSEETARAMGLEAHFVERESADALRVLSQFAQRAADPDSFQSESYSELRTCSAALGLSAAHRLHAAVPFLRALEPIDLSCSVTSTVAFESGYWLLSNFLRPLVSHALRVLGEEPSGYSVYHFTENYEQIDPRLPVPECVPNRVERAKQLTCEMTALDVLQLIGAPDHRGHRSRQVGTVCDWFENWEYDFLTPAGWSTLRIVWGDRSERGRILEIAEGPAAWLESDQRERELFDD